MPPNPELAAGPQARGRLTGPAMQKALPAARQIQVGPSSSTRAPPVPKTEPPTPKAPPTNGAIKAAREAWQTPTEKAKPFFRRKPNSWATSKPVSEACRPPTPAPETDKVAEAIIEKRPGDRLFANQRAEEIETILAHPERYDPEEVEGRDSKTAAQIAELKAGPRTPETTSPARRCL